MGTSPGGDNGRSPRGRCAMEGAVSCHHSRCCCCLATVHEVTMGVPVVSEYKTVCMHMKDCFSRSRCTSGCDGTRCWPDLVAITVHRFWLVLPLLKEMNLPLDYVKTYYLLSACDQRITTPTCPVSAYFGAKSTGEVLRTLPTKMLFRECVAPHRDPDVRYFLSDDMFEACELFLETHSSLAMSTCTCVMAKDRMPAPPVDNDLSRVPTSLIGLILSHRCATLQSYRRNRCTHLLDVLEQRDDLEPTWCLRQEAGSGTQMATWQLMSYAKSPSLFRELAKLVEDGHDLFDALIGTTPWGTPLLNLIVTDFPCTTVIFTSNNDYKEFGLLVALVISSLDAQRLLDYFSRERSGPNAQLILDGLHHLWRMCRWLMTFDTLKVFMDNIMKVCTTADLMSPWNSSAHSFLNTLFGSMMRLYTNEAQERHARKHTDLFLEKMLPMMMQLLAPSAFLETPFRGHPPFVYVCACGSLEVVSSMIEFIQDDMRMSGLILGCPVSGSVTYREDSDAMVAAVKNNSMEVCSFLYMKAWSENSQFARRMAPLWAKSANTKDMRSMFTRNLAKGAMSMCVTID